MRLLIPFIIAFIIEIPALIFVKEFSVLKIVFAFFEGGVGPGSYYTPVMIQLIFVTPVIYFIIRKYDFIGVMYCFIFTGIYEATAYCVGCQRTCTKFFLLDM